MNIPRDKRVVSLLFAGCILFVSVFLLLKAAKADTWAWSTGIPVAESADDVSRSYSWLDQCQSRFGSQKESVAVQGADSDVTPTTDCLMAEGENVKMYSYGGYQGLAVQFAGDLYAHQIRGISCESSCIYLPSRDMFVKIETNNDVRSGRVAIYKNFVSKLRRQNALTLNQRYYSFDQAVPDQTISDFSDKDGYVGYAKYIQRSSNDKWMVVEFVGKGLYRIDMDTMQMLKFSDWQTQYWYAGPTIEFDVTDDGQRVAVMGLNSEGSIYDIVPGCGNIMPANLTEGALDQHQQTACPEVNLAAPNGDPSNNTYMPRMKDTYQPVFSDDGGEITFYATSSDNSLSPRQITLRAENYMPSPPLDYLALGDSFSSGEGDIDPYGKNYYHQGTDVEGNKDLGIPQEKCHVSTRSYPYLLALGMGLSNDGRKQWDTVACSGAMTPDIANSQEEWTDLYQPYLGQGDRLKGFDAGELKYQALNEFIPGRQRQIEFVREYKPKVITLTMGGNDIDLVGKLHDCVTGFGTCSYVNEGRSTIASEIFNEYGYLKDLYTKLYNASGKKAKIYVLGYPNIINSDASASCGTNVLLLNASERALATNSIAYLNNVIKQAARAAGVKYIDIENSLDGHRLCDRGDEYVDGVATLLGVKGLQDQGSFHPNAKGQQSIALSVWDEQNVNHVSLLDYNICPGSEENMCPDDMATKDGIYIPQYFQSVSSNKNIHYKQMTPFEQFFNGVVDVSMGARTFVANGIASIAGFSTPADLGQYTVGADGSLHAHFILPKSMEVGFHRIIISGESYSGDPVEYEQTILVKGSDPNDVDADGIPDSRDKCLFISPSN